MDRSLLLSKKGVVLLVVDVQEKFQGAVPRFNEMVGNIVRLVLTFQMYDMPIIVTEQYPAGLGSTVEPVRKLFSFLEVIEKMEFSATDNAHFWPQVNAIKPHTFVVCGLETHVCVNQTVIKLIEKGMQVHVVADAVASRNALDHNVALRKMERAGAIIGTTEMCLFELTEKAGTESFKNIQRMVRGKFALSRPQKSPEAAADQTTMQTGKEKKTSTSSTQTASLGKNGGGPKKQSAATDEVLDMIDSAEPTAVVTPEAALDSGAEAAELVEVDALLETIDTAGSGPKTANEKSEADIDKDIRDIDTLIGNLGLDSGEAK